MITDFILSTFSREGAFYTWFLCSAFIEPLFYLLFIAYCVQRFRKKSTRVIMWIFIVLLFPYGYFLKIDLDRGNSYAPNCVDFNGAKLGISRKNPILLYCGSYRPPHWSDGGELVDQVHLFAKHEQFIIYKVTMTLGRGDFKDDNRDYVLVDTQRNTFYPLKKEEVQEAVWDKMKKSYYSLEWKGAVTEITSNPEYEQTDKWLRKTLKKKIGVEYDDWIQERIEEEQTALMNLGQ